MNCHWKNGQGYCMAPHCDCNQGRNCPARTPARYRQNQTVNQRALWIVIGGGALMATLLALIVGG